MHLMVLLVVHTLLTIKLRLEGINFLPQTHNRTLIRVILHLLHNSYYDHRMTYKINLQSSLPFPKRTRVRWRH